MLGSNQFFKKTSQVALVLALVGIGTKAAPAILSLNYSFKMFAQNFPVQQEPDGALGAYDVAVAANGAVYASSHVDGYVYQFNAGNPLPNMPSPANRLNATAMSGGISGLCVSQAQRLYLARLDQGDVVELNPATGAIVREVATDIPCASHLAQDPVSGDLFVSSVCENSIFRLNAFESVTGSANVTPYCTGVNGPDGLGFGPDGTLYVAALDGLDTVSGTNSESPGTEASLVPGASFNGLAVQPGAPGLKPFLYACNSNGALTLYDANYPGGNPTAIFFGAQRGEGLALDGNGNLYVTQSSGLAVIDLANGSPLPGPQPTATPSASPTDTPTPVPSNTASPTVTITATESATFTPIPTSAISIGSPVEVATGAFVGLAASRDRLYGTLIGSSNVYLINAQGQASLYSQLPNGSESYIAISPGLGGFPANHVFVTKGTQIYDVDTAGNATLFASLPNNPGTHCGLVFDTIGSWGYDLLVTGGPTGAVWRVKSNGTYSQVAQLNGVVEGLDVAPADFAPYGGYLFVPDESNSNVYAISPVDNSVSVPITWPSAEWVQFLWGSACSLTGTDFCFFETHYSQGIYGYPTEAFVGLGSRAIVGSESSGGIGLVSSDGSNLSVGLLAGQGFTREGAAFVNCEVPAFPAIINQATIKSPLLSAQNTGPFDITGIVQVNDTGNYSLSYGKSDEPAYFTTFYSAPVVTISAGVLGSLDLSGNPDGVYQLKLSVLSSEGKSLQSTTIVSKGKFRYQETASENQAGDGYLASAENTANGHLFESVSPTSLVEFAADGDYVETFSLPATAQGLAADGSYLYVSYPDLGTVARYQLPSGVLNDESPVAGALVQQGGLSGFTAPGPLLLAGGQLFVVDNGAGTVRAFDAASLNESPVSNYGVNYLNQAADAAADTTNAVLYVADEGRIVKFSMATGMVTGEYPGLGFNDLVMDPTRSILYGTNWNTSSVEAVDARNGAFLGKTEGYGFSEGRFMQPFGLRFTQAGLLMVGDGEQNRMQMLQPIVPEPSVSLSSPLLSLQDAGPFSVSGIVQGDSSIPLYPNDAVTSWSLSFGKSADASSFGAPALSGSGSMQGVLGQADLSQMPDGVYDAVLKAATQDGLNFTANTFVSKGQFRFQGSLSSPGFLTAGATVAVEMAPGGDFLVASPDSGTLVELDPNGLYIRQHSTGLDSVDGMAVMGTTLYVSSATDGAVQAYPLPATQGQGLGAPTASVNGLNMPAGITVQDSVLYVAEDGAHDVRAYSLPGLTPTQASPYGAAYLGLDYDVYDVAVNASAGELYVLGDDDIVVFSLASGAWLRELTPGVNTLNSLVYDTASGLIFASGASGAIYAVNPATGGVSAQTEGGGLSEGQFMDPESLRETAAGLLVVADKGTGKVQLLQPEPVNPSAQINAPLLSLQNAGPFTVLGSVQAGNNSSLPSAFQQLTSYTLTLGQTGSAFHMVGGGAGSQSSAPVGSVDLTGKPDGVYALCLSATTQDSQAASTTFVSKGRFNFQAAYTLPGVKQGYSLAVENPSNDHLFVALSATSALDGTTMTPGVLELDANGLFVAEYGLTTTADGLACDGQYLYIASALNGTVSKLPLPTPGAPLGSPAASISGLMQPRGLALDNGVLMVVESGAQVVRAYSTANLTEQGVSRYGAGYLDKNHCVDLAVNSAGNELYVTDGGRVVAYQISTGQYLREFKGPGNLIMGLAFDPAQGVLYLSEQSQSLLEALNPSNGAVLGTFGGHGIAEGQFAALQGLRLDHSARLLAGDAGNNRLQVFQAVVPTPTAQLISPLLSLQTGAPVPVMGTVQVSALPLVPQAALASYMVTLGKSYGLTPTAFANGTANVSNGTLGALNLSASPNGVYKIQLSATDQSNFAYQDQTFVSKGKYRFQAAYQSADEGGNYAVSVENPANQHLFAGIDSGTASTQLKILEMRGDGRWVEESTLTLSPAGEIAGLACDGESLFILTDAGGNSPMAAGQLLRYALPSADGAPLVGPLDQATVLPAGPSGMVLGQGQIYVAAHGEVLAYNSAQLSAAPQALGQGYLQDGGANGIALNAAASELYVADTSRVVVLGLDGGYRRQFNLNFPASARGMAYDPSLGILHLANAAAEAVQSYDPLSPSAGTFLGATEGPGSSEGQFQSLQGLFYPAQGQYLVAGDDGMGRIQLIQPEVAKGFADIASPLASLQNQGPFVLDGNVQVQGLQSWTLSWGQTAQPSGYQTINSGSGAVSDAPLGTLDLSNAPNGVYQVLLSAVDSTGFTFSGSTFVSKGQFRFQAAYHHYQDTQGYAWAVQMPGPQGHLFVSMAGSPRITELDATGNFVASTILTDGHQIGGLALDIPNQTLDVSLTDAGVVEAFSLPASYGAPLIPAHRSWLVPSPMGLQVAGGKLYVTDSRDQQVYLSAASTTWVKPSSQPTEST